MKHPTVIKLIMTQRRVTRKHVANKLGIKDIGTLFKDINHEHLYINRLVAVLDALDYQLVFQPKGKGTMPERSYPIRWSDYHNE